MPIRNTLHLLAGSLCLLLVCTTTALAQEDWKFAVDPGGGSANSIFMWGDTGIACGIQNSATIDGGRSWNFCFQYTMSAVAQGSGQKGWGATTHGMFMTTNAGLTWTQSTFPWYGLVSTVISAEPGRRIASYPNASGRSILMQATEPNDDSWSSITPTGLPANWSFLDLVSNPRTHTLIMTLSEPTHSGGQFYRSTDMGKTWGPLSMTGLPTDNVVVEGSGWIQVVASGTLFTPTSRLSGGAWEWSTYRSTDDGNTWMPITGGFPPFAAFNYLVQAPSGDLYSTAAIMNVTEFTWQYFGMYRSTDDGMSWTETPDVGLPQKFASNVAVAPNGTLFALGDRFQAGGIYRSTNNGATWVPSDSGIGTTVLVGAEVSVDGRLYVCSPASGVYRFYSGSWTRLDNGMPGWGWKHIRLSGRDTVFAADTVNGIYRSIDHGDSWVNIASGLSNLHITAFDLTRSGTLVICTDAGVQRSTTAGNSWNAAAGGIPPGVRVRQLGVRRDGMIVAATDVGPYISTDDGDHWTVATTGLVNPACFSVGFCHDNTIMLGNGTTVYRSSDDGQHWLASDAGISRRTSKGCFFRAFATRRNGNIVASRAGDSVFVLVSTDNGLSWWDDRNGVLANFRGLNIYGFASDSTDQLLAALDYGLRVAEPTASAVHAGRALPRITPLEISLIGADPAPTETVVRVTIPATGEVTFSVVDGAGRTVWRSEPSTLQQGAHVRTIPTDQLGGGVYHCIATMRGRRGSVPFVVAR